MVRLKTIIPLFAALIIISSCKPDENRFTINGNIKGAEGKYIKYINMLNLGLNVDSIYIDMGSNFTLSEISNEPIDFVFYFNNEESIRLMAGVNEIITLTGNYNNLLESYKVKGSPESELLSQILKKNAEVIHAIDTMDMFYMKNQQHPKLDSIVEQLRYLSDSVVNEQNTYLRNFIKTNPSSLASYIALSLKLNHTVPYFIIPNDMDYFNMVDTAIANRYDSIKISNMLHTFIEKRKHTSKEVASIKTLSIGDTVPDIVLPNVYGDTLMLSSLKGKFVLIDFWGSWCKPCRTENKNLRTVYYSYRNRGFQVFQVAIERNKDDWKNTIKEDKLSWKYQVSDLQYMKSETAKAYGLKALPANFLIDHNGVIIAKNLYGEEVFKKLNEVLPKPTYVRKDTAAKVSN